MAKTVSPMFAEVLERLQADRKQAAVITGQSPCSIRIFAVVIPDTLGRDGEPPQDSGQLAIWFQRPGEKVAHGGQNCGELDDILFGLDTTLKGVGSFFFVDINPLQFLYSRAAAQAGWTLDESAPTEAPAA